jgi:signal transduction histidine kinase
MTGKEEKRNIKTYAALVFVLVFLFALTLMYLVNQEQEQEEKLKATYMAEATVSRVEAQLSQYLTKADVLKNLVEDGHELNDEQFKVMQDDTHIIEAIELAQDGIITQVYPLAGNEKAVGLDFFADPAREKEANLAMQSGQYTIAGPFELRQGGMGVLLFDPIYTTDEQGEQSFWGFSVMVLNWENFIEDMELQSLENASYHYQIWRRSMSTGEKVTIAQCDNPVLDNPLEVVCEVPNDTWYFEIVPKNGWISRTQQFFSVIFAFVLATLLTMGYWQSAWRRHREVVYAEKLGMAARKEKQANEAKTRFLFNMSHDMRTPMNAIIGYSDLLDQHADEPEKVSDYIGKIRSSSNLLLSLINYVLEMARIESGKITLKEEVGCFTELMDSLRIIFEPTIQKKHLTYNCQMQIGHDYVIADRTKLREVIFNIISNAIKYTPDGGAVSVKLEEQETEMSGRACYRIVVEDTGIGMSKDYLPHIFEEFTRERTSTESKVAGAGLGMPIVKALVDLMGGTVQVESEEGHGTRFTIELELPIASEQQIHEKKENQIEELAKNLNGCRILLAEDNDLNAEIAMTILQEHGVCDHTLVPIGVGPRHVDEFRAVILMPVMNGYDAARAIRQLTTPHAAVSIIAMTANAFEEDKQKAFAAGMDAYITKPVDVVSMMKTLHQIIETHRSDPDLSENKYL